MIILKVNIAQNASIPCTFVLGYCPSLWSFVRGKDFVGDTKATFKIQSNTRWQRRRNYTKSKCFTPSIQGAKFENIDVDSIPLALHHHHLPKLLLIFVIPQLPGKQIDDPTFARNFCIRHHHLIIPRTHDFAMRHIFSYFNDYQTNGTVAIPETAKKQ